MKFNTLFQIHEHFAHYISLVKEVHYSRNPVRRELFIMARLHVLKRMVHHTFGFLEVLESQ